MQFSLPLGKYSAIITKKPFFLAFAQYTPPAHASSENHAINLMISPLILIASNYRLFSDGMLTSLLQPADKIISLQNFRSGGNSPQFEKKKS